MMSPSELRDALASLDDREREIVRLRFGLDRGEPCTLEEVGEHFNLTRERIRQLEGHALTKLGETSERYAASASSTDSQAGKRHSGQGRSATDECVHGLAPVMCSLCSSASRFGDHVWVTGHGSAFHSREDCHYMLEGQAWAEEQGKERTKIQVVPISMALSDSREPCLLCYRAR
jgi:hypothetical protein